MRKIITKLLDKGILWGLRGSEVGRFDGIGLADLRTHGDSFRRTMEESLCLVRDHAPRRYAQIKCFIHWIANRMDSKGSGGGYDFSIRTCHLEFYDEFPGLVRDVMVAVYACILVHESTHGRIESLGIQYRGDDRARVERLCVQEQNRFAAKLVALDPDRYPASCLLVDFKASDWQEHWSMTPLGRGLSLLSRTWADRNRTRRLQATAR